MSPVAAGGVVAWVDGESDSEIANVALREGSYGCHVPLVFASDLEACQQHCQGLEQRVIDCVAQIERDTQYLTAAQAEADRLRVDAERYRWLATQAEEELCVRVQGENIIHRHLHAYYQIKGPNLAKAIDTAIHAAKTEQERGE